jgi:hypothetical protein
MASDWRPARYRGQHPLGLEALVQRVLGDQGLEAAEYLGVASRRELGVDLELDGTQVKHLEAADLGAGEGLFGNVGQRGSAPQRERVVGGPVHGDSPLRLTPGALDAALESRRVNRVLRKR